MENVDNSIGTIVGRTFRVLRNSLQKRFEDSGYNVTLEQWLILLLLTIKDGRNQNELSNSCDKEKTTMTRMIDGLHKKGLVERKQAPLDRRSNLIYITNKGKKLESILTPIAIKQNQLALKGFTENEIKLFFSLMNRVTDNLKEYNNEDMFQK